MTIKQALPYLALAGGLLAGLQVQAADVSPPAVSNPCAGCHGTGGASAGLSMPSLAGLPREYVHEAMEEFKSGKRYSSIMGRLAKGYSDDDFKAMAAFFEGQPWSSMPQQVDAALAGKGQKIHEEKCSVCHLDNGRYTEYTLPRLAGQWLEYLQIQMREYKTREPRMAQPKLMRVMMDSLAPDDLTALAHFYASQK
jgi:sulfide dehydrogenase cytochrome subunit